MRTRNHIDLRCYLVLDANLCGTPEKMAQTALSAVKGGATVVQLRAPEWKKKKQLEAALLIKEALKGTGVPLIIDDHVDIALISQADGVHVGQEDLPVSEARRLLGDKAVIGLSVGSLEELGTLNADADYIGAGPVFSTATKKDAGSAIGLQTLAAIRRATSVPIVAIGGINSGNTAEVMKTGVEGVAVVSAICGTEDPEESTRLIRKEVDG